MLAAVTGDRLQQHAEQPVRWQDLPRDQHLEELGHGAQRGALQQRRLGQLEHGRQQHLHGTQEDRDRQAATARRDSRRRYPTKRQDYRCGMKDPLSGR